ncbi:phospholipid-transporting ATPase ABCA3-like isoform X2 [Tribolium madens]|uniref:phospholipid-transporting ATPase ABCA3-like isoform X2 n=1 Tax=Tribolium madens TaxID=41895 RepID=UPI001CF73A80|nr:phospholipid-transporting ATPase ABCA3-like isoform X2 [Tribolium madens]
MYVNSGTMGKKLDKFLLLMWKNWLLQYRRPLQTLVEILAPVLFSILLVVIRSLVDPETNPAKIYTPFCLLPILCSDQSISTNQKLLTNFENSTFINFTLVYSPYSNKAVRRSMGILETVLGGHVVGYNNSDQLEAHFLDSNSSLTFAAIQLDDSLAQQDTLPDDLEVSLRFPSELRMGFDLFGQNNWHTNLLYPVYQVPGPRAPENNTGALPDKLRDLDRRQRTWRTNILFPIYQSPGPRSPRSDIGGKPGYFKEGFLTLQLVMTYIFAIGGHLEATTLEDFQNMITTLRPPLVKMQRFPYGSWVEDPLLQALESFVGIIIMLSFVYTCINTVKVITTEKEKQLKEAMKIMGLPNWLHWTAWFLKAFVFLLISVILIIVLLKISWYPHTEYSVFTYADPTVMLAFLLLYVCATITFCFAISVFFSKANTAATVAGLVWFLSYAPYLFLQKQYDQLSLSTKLMASLGSNTAMAYGFQLMLMYEGTSEGIQWSNIGKPNTPDDSLTLGYIMLMLIIDTFIYLFVALYVEAVFPGEYGVPLPWYFPFTSSYWCGHPSYVGVEDFSSVPSQEGEFFEKEPNNLTPGIQIRNLRKVFGQKAAVRNLSLNMYNDQITVLLGHNGAGKTTTMSMLTGMFPPTSGTAVVCGHDIKTDMDGVRESLGLCPQHNIIFDELTVREHLYFFSKLKGLKHEAINEEIDKYVELLELQPKANAKSATLSGGMKRKLCVGMALCGNSKVVMLDEPTAGMDPSARRALWDLLQNQKHGRTMLLTTHFMDEADLLGDRIAIMAGGELQCCGSSFFLKKKYGTGYHLIMDKASNCQEEHVTGLLRRHIPNIEMHGNVGSELTYLLSEEHSSVFEEMLRDLEENSASLGIRSYGISLTTLEEVFMKVGADHGQEENYNGLIQETKCNKTMLDKIKSKLKRNGNYENNINETTLTLETSTLLTGFMLIKNQFLAMLMKKVLSIIRTWILQFIQILMPVAFLIIAIVVSRNTNKSADLPKLPITLNSYRNPITLIEDNANDSFSALFVQTLKGYEIKNVTNITSEMLDLTETVPSTVRLRYIVGASFDKVLNGFLTSITAWFNNNPYHSPPLALGLVLNVVYKHLAGTNRSIKWANYPLPFTADTKVQQLLEGNSMGFQLAFNIGFSMAFVSSFYVLFYVRERVCKSKHLQFVSGVKVYIFWLMSFICDIITFIVTIIAIIITLACFQEDGFRSSEDLARMSLLLFYFGIAMLPMMYFASYFFEVPSTGYTRMTLFSVFTGVAAFLVVQVLATPGLDLEYVANTLHWIFLVVPHYSLATGIRDVYTTFATNKMCKYAVQTCVENRPDMTIDKCWDLTCHNASVVLQDYCCVREPDYYKWRSPGIGRNLLYSFSVGIVLFILLNMKEYKIFSKAVDYIVANYKNKFPQPVEDEDSDVAEEKHKIHSTSESELQNDYILVLKDLTKYYNNFLAVNGLCLGVKECECFGLLGINGAGKTTTFKMMTGDVKITHGEAWVKTFSIKTELKQVQKLIGYCPQFDALLDDLTAKESLIMFALLRGVPMEDCQYLVHKLSKDFDFQRHLNKKVKELSGGNKRKLSTAISLIGDPPVIYLDEPTTGMDPATKRYLWDAICKVRDNGKCVVLTSHSMEECEALCTRLAIMVNGNFKCLGSTQHLKNKFAEGYTLTIKLKKSPGGEDVDIKPIENFISDHFPKAIQREKHQELLTYYIVDKSIPWSRMFGILEKGKKQLNIEDYSLGQSSLEQVFLSFTRLQR